MDNFMNDYEFLKQLDSYPLKETFARITLLNFKNEYVQEIQGRITTGNMTVNGSSAIRRTISLTIIPDKGWNSITDAKNIVSINKKAKVELGLRNRIKGYEKYGDIIWFKLGTYIISEASIQNSTNSYTISIKGSDPMVLLNGEVGGIFPAAVDLDKISEMDPQGNLHITKVTLYEVIYQMVSEYGGINKSEIIINDLDVEAKLQVKYLGKGIVYVSKNYDSLNNFDVAFGTTPSNNDNEYIRYAYGDDIGYIPTPLTYPGDLTVKPGETVQSVLDKIIKVLGNYEYFFDIDGRFIFQEKKNYLNTTYSPENFNICNIESRNYFRAFSDTRYAYVFDNGKTVQTFNNAPQYKNIKNDFIIWGQHKTATGQTFQIRYHLRIEHKPQSPNNYLYLRSYKDEKDPNKTIQEIYYSDSSIENQTSGKYTYKLISGWNETAGSRAKAMDWREAIYRSAWIKNFEGDELDYIEKEILTEWRKLYNPVYASSNYFDQELKINYKFNDEGWNVNVLNDPSSITYWLDYLDTNDEIMEYAVSAIGCRSKVVVNDKTTALFNKPIPDIIYLKGLTDKDIENYKNSESYDPLHPFLIDYQSELIERYKREAQPFYILSAKDYEFLGTSGTQVDAFTQVRELLYQHLTYNATITITCIPKYYLEPNTLIQVYDDKTGIKGDYVITQFTLPLTYNGTMSITASEALIRY